ncbi:MAG: NYN domain-containing protein [Actinobacteria bacterium]|nr:NYN domain-containing protein [Actinomycetota bacterium]
MTTISLAPRSLHLVDLENLVGDPAASGPEALDALARFLAVAEWHEGDLVQLAANPGLLREVAFDLPVPCNPHAVRGDDAADAMLLSHAVPEWVAARFDRLVVGSGDHAFAPRAVAVRDLGVPVVIVSRPGSLSSALQGRGLGVRLLPAPARAREEVLAA